VPGSRVHPQAQPEDKGFNSQWKGKQDLAELQDLVEAYLGKLEVRPIPHTRLVRIAFRSPNPQLCALVANAHAQAYIRQGIDLRSEANEAGLRFLEEKLVELKERVEQSEAALNQYRREKGIISLDDKENIVIDRLADLNKRLTEAEAERIGLEAQVQLLRTGRFDSLPGVIGNPLIQSLKQQLTTVEGEVAHLATQFKDDYPPLKQLRAQVAETQRRLEQEMKRAADGIMAAYQSAVGKET
jgi:GumC protein